MFTLFGMLPQTRYSNPPWLAIILHTSSVLAICSMRLIFACLLGFLCWTGSLSLERRGPVSSLPSQPLSCQSIHPTVLLSWAFHEGIVSTIHTAGTTLTVLLSSTWSALPVSVQNDFKLALTCVARTQHLSIAWITSHTSQNAHTLDGSLHRENHGRAIWREARDDKAQGKGFFP